MINSKLLFLTFTLCSAACVFADDPLGPAPGSAWMMSDGDKVYPTNSAATPTQIQSLQSTQTTLSGRVASTYAISTGAVDAANSALDVVRHINQDDIVVSQVFVTSIGSQSAANSNQIIKILGFLASGSPVTNIHVIGEFDQLQTTRPGLDWRSSLSSLGESSSEWLALDDVVCSWPSVVAHPNATQPFVYSFDVPIIGAPASMFVRVISHDDGGAGSGFYFIIYNGLIINGRMGQTITLVDDAGGTNDFISGILCRPLEESL